MKTITPALPTTISDSARREAFYSTMRLIATPDEIGLVKSLLETPLSELSDFELARSQVKTPEQVELLVVALEFGMVQGDWRRVAFRRLINAIGGGT